MARFSCKHLGYYPVGKRLVSLCRSGKMFYLINSMRVAEGR